MNIQTTILGGGWVGGFQSVVTIRLSQPSFAGFRAGAELGNLQGSNRKKLFLVEIWLPSENAGTRVSLLYLIKLKHLLK